MRDSRRRRVGALPWTGLLLATMAGVWAAPQSSAPAPDGPISVDTVAVPLNPRNPSETAIGDFVYAGGLVLTSRQTDQLHGLSDLALTGVDRIAAVGDFGTLFEARLVLDGSARLVGLTDARLSLLTGEDGRPLPDKVAADAEGLAQLANGDRLVSFERRDRIWLYPAGGGPPRPAPSPKARFPENSGMEALAPDPEAGADAYVVGAEASGDTWTCRLRSTCVKGPTVDKPKGFGLVALRRLPGIGTAYVIRGFDQVRGTRVTMRILRANRVIASLDLAAPKTVDNFEGLAAVPLADGRIRFYLLSDDNALPSQRTLLLAFDWQPR